MRRRGEISVTVAGIDELQETLEQTIRRLDAMAVGQAELDADIQALTTSVDALIALVQTPAAPLDLQPQADEVNALKANVDAAVAAAAPAP